MQVLLQKEQRIVDENCSGTAKELLAKLGVNPETVLIVKDGKLITLEDSIDDAEKIELLSVISGG